MLMVSIYGPLKQPAQGRSPSYSQLEYRGSREGFKGGCDVNPMYEGVAYRSQRGLIGSGIGQNFVAQVAISD